MRWEERGRECRRSRNDERGSWEEEDRGGGWRKGERTWEEGHRRTELE